MTSNGELLERRLTESIIGSFFDVYRELGFGYREYLYSLAMERDLIAKGHKVRREVAVMVYFRREPLAPQTFDMIVDDKVVVENKARERLQPGACDQLFSYLCSTDLEVGLVLHFGREPKFYRVVFENRYKRRNKPSGREKT